MRLNVEFRVELPKTNPGLAKSHFQQETRGYAQKLPSTVFELSTSQGFGYGEVGVEENHNGLYRELWV